MDVRAYVLSQMTVFADPRVTPGDAKAAEAALQGLGGAPGFGVVLLDLLAADPPIPRSLRQLAGVLLERSVVKAHWQPVVGDGAAPVPEVPEGDKAVIRARLPAMLTERDPAVRDRIASALSSVGVQDWPARWPAFTDGLAACVTGLTADIPGATAAALESGDISRWLRCDGALRCLGRFVDAVSTREAVSLAQGLLARLLHVAGLSVPEVAGAAPSHFILGLKSRAFGVIGTLLSALEAARHDQASKRSVTDLMRVAAAPLLGVCASTIALPLFSGPAIAAKHSAFSALNVLLLNFAGLLSPHLAALVDGLFALLPRWLELYVHVEVDDRQPPRDGEPAPPRSLTALLDASDRGGADSELAEDGTVGILLALFMQWLQLCVGSKKKALRSVVGARAAEIAGLLVTACQLTAAALISYDDDPEAFVLDEDSSESLLFLGAVNLRHEAPDLILDCLDIALERSLRAISVSALAALGAAQGSGGAAWSPGPLAGCPGVVLSAQRWKAAEAALYVAGRCRKELISYSRDAAAAAAPGASSAVVERAARWAAAAGGPLPFTAATLTPHLVSLLHSGAADIVGGSAGGAGDAAERAAAAQYVMGRALKTAGDLGRGAPEDVVGATLAAAVDGLQPAHSLPIRTAACHALERLLPLAPAAALAAAAPVILERAAALVCASSVAAIPYPVNVIVRTVTYAPRAGAAAVPALLPPLLLLWTLYAPDPFVGPTLATAVEALSMLQPEDDPAATATAQAEVLALALPAFAAVFVAAVDATAAQVLVPLVGPAAAAGRGARSIPITVACANPQAAFAAVLPAHREAVANLMIHAPGTIATSLAPSAVEASITALRAIGPARGAAGAPRRPLQPEFATLVATAVRCALANADHKVRGSTCTLAAVAIRRYGHAGGGLLVEGDAAAAGRGLALVDAVRLVSVTLGSGDVAAALAAPLATAIAGCAFEAGGAAALMPLVDALLPLLVSRLASDNEVVPSLACRLLMAVACLILSAPGPVCAALGRTVLRVDARAKAAPPLSAAATAALNDAARAGRDVSVSQSAAAVVLRAWCIFHGVLAGSRIVERTVKLAVLRLLEEQAADPSLLVAVQAETAAGPPVPVETAGPNTRARAKASGLKLEAPPVPLPVRAAALLVSDWLDASDEADAGDEEAAEEEEEAEDDDDGADDDGEDDGGDDDEEEEDESKGGEGGKSGDGPRRARGGGRRPFMDAEEAAALYGHFDEDGDGGGVGGVSAKDVIDLNALLVGGWKEYFGAGGDDDDDDGGGDDGGDDGARSEAIEDLEVWTDVADEGKEEDGGGLLVAAPAGAALGAETTADRAMPRPLDPLLARVLEPGASLAVAGAAVLGGVFARVQGGGADAATPLAQVLRAAAVSLAPADQKRLFARLSGLGSRGGASR